MKSIWRFTAFIFGPGLLLAILSISYAAINAFVLNNCDSKLGCSGIVALTAFISGIALILSSVSHAITSIGYKKTLENLGSITLISTISILGAFQWILFLTFDIWPISSVFGTGFAWFCASFAMSWLVLEIIQRWAYNKSFKRTAAPKFE
jgi:hypothetical protein